MENHQDQKMPPVVCAGILVADIFVPPLSQLPGAGQLLATDDFLLETGGCAANVATSLAKLDVPALVVGKIGDDLFGDFIERKLSGNGVLTDGLSRTQEYGTSKTLILPVVGEDRRYIHTFGANNAFQIDDVNRSLIEASQLFYLGGYLVLPNLAQEGLAELFQHARQNDVVTVLDVVVPDGSRNYDIGTLKQVLPLTDFFMPNDDEARILTGEQDPERQAEIFIAAGCGTVIITMGERGTFLMSADEKINLPPYQIDFVDGSGAGDAFAAGFIVGLIEGWNILETIRFASAIGASACTALGCTAGVFTRTEAQTYLAQQ